ncbi:MAG: hypothetical protein ACXU89_22195, partial [Xanthobacteraceae bacterium]
AKVEYSLAASERRDPNAALEGGLFDISDIARPFTRGRSASPAAQKPCKTFMYKSLNFQPHYIPFRAICIMVPLCARSSECAGHP